MKRLTKFIDKNISGKKVLGLFILTNVVYTFMLTVTIPKTMEFSKGMKLLDMMPTGYDLDYVRELFSLLGENGRLTYLNNQIPVDMIYPLLFGLSYCLLLGYLLKKLNKLNSVYNFLCLLPIIAGIADYLENIGIIVMLKNYPELTEVAVKSTSSFSLIKSISTSVLFIVLIVTLIIFGIKRIKSKRY
ncbi:hypothetical protein J8L88_04830 [Aquimarina sp. MMG015]|uniref:hypothetical protein n=1 Tax=unclassified Aquimarina TaxID=2627091 RepID=UPI000E475F5E|nr:MULTISPECIES: hypothetical protein [unclassified Aquimarina]AXT55212.1 hypothetical protein D1815_05360 [Aquimarina sp. AD1]MBQ4802171.1 hypothetical protein [Aquimarina sp. MMG015]RKN10754.1 hypothetical protein D7035_19375 [Aquimarina sp. AD1]